MSISETQMQRVLAAVAQRLYAGGVDPTLTQVLQRVSSYFAKYSVGQPLPFPVDGIRSKERSDVVSTNLILAHLKNNLDVLYEVCLGQVDEIMTLSTLMQSDIDRLTTRRQRVETQIDDYLLSLYNTDGYFYSISDVFTDTSLTDLNLTTGFVDTDLNEVVLPTVASLTNTVPASLLGTPAIVAYAFPIGSGAALTSTNTVNFNTISPFSFATDGTTNTVWEVQVLTSTPQEVVVTVTVPLGNSDNKVELSRADIEPYGITPVQLFAEAGQSDNTTGTVTYKSFGTNIVTGLSPVSFVDSLGDLTSFRFTFRKSQFDYSDDKSGTIQYHYVFGAKRLAFSEHVYDNNCTLVSIPLTIPAELSNDIVIDAVSLAVVDSVPAETSISYFVANDTGDVQSLSDLNWHAIEPVGTINSTLPEVIHFDGAQAFEQLITENPGANDLQLTALDSTNPDLSKRNPSPSIIPAIDTYVLADFTDTPITNSMTLTEGINSTKIYWTPYTAAAVQNLDYWGNIINGNSTVTPQLVFGHIDKGNGFFYGGDVGQSGVSAYVETYLQLDSAIDPVLAKINKSDPNSQTWSIRAFLNGREVGYLPGRNQDTIAGTGATTLQTPVDSLLVPWGFQQGLNHIAVLINIPSSTQASGIANPYIGTLDLLQGHDLFEFGTVKLADWSYVTFFDLQYNQAGTPQTFTIYNNQIISRRQPTTNFRLSYNKATNTGPSGVRVRADLSRSVQNSHVTPKLQSYRLRFSYGSMQQAQ